MQIDHSLKAEIANELQADENVLWIGKPKGGIVFRLSDIFLIPFSVVWCGFCCVWMFFAIWGDAPLIFILFGIPFLVIGFKLLIIRFFTDRKRRENTVYALTNQRVLIYSTYPKKYLTTLNLADIMESKVKKHKNGSQTLFFGTKYLALRGNVQVNWPGMKPNPIFEFIEDAESVDKLLEKEIRG